MKKIIVATLMTVVMGLALVACGKKEEPKEDVTQQILDEIQGQEKNDENKKEEKANSYEVSDEVLNAVPGEFKIQIFDMVFIAGMSPLEANEVIDESNMQDVSIIDETEEHRGPSDGVDPISRGYTFYTISGDGWEFHLNYCHDKLCYVGVADSEKIILDNMYIFGGIKSGDEKYTTDSIKEMLPETSRVSEGTQDSMYWMLYDDENVMYYYNIQFDDKTQTVSNMAICFNAD